MAMSGLLLFPGAPIVFCSSCLLILAVTACVLPCMQVGAAEETRTSALKIRIIVDPAIPLSWHSPIAAFVEEAMWSEVHIISATNVAGETCVPCGEIDTETNGVTVVLCPDGQAGEDVNTGMVMDPVRHCGTLRTGLLEPQGEDVVSGSAKTDELWLTRVQKQTGAVVARLIGLTECPFWLCVIHADASMGDVDFKGRDLCPPCLDLLRHHLGIPD